MLIELSIAINYFTPTNDLDPILDKILFNSISIFLGMKFLLSFFLKFISKPQLIKIKAKSKKNKKNKFTYRLQSLVITTELKNNVFFSLYTYIVVIGIVLIKEMQLPNLKWQLIEQPYFLKFLFNSLIIFGLMLIFWSIIDFFKLIFNLKFTLTKMKSKVEN
jgi:hypothetical protein